MNKSIFHICFVVAMLNFSTIYAQFTMQGKVMLEGSNTPLAGIEITHNDSIVISDVEGNFSFKNISKGESWFYTFSEDYGVNSYARNIIENVEEIFIIPIKQYDLTAIDVVAKREELFAIKQLNDIEETSIFAGKKSEVVILSLAKGNLANNNGRQVYAQVAGLNIYEGNSGGLQLNLGGRGLDPNRTSNFNTRQNGYDISADVLGYPENYYTPPSEAIEEIRIVRGASSLQYGTQFGGLIDFKLRKIPSFKKWEIISKQTIGSFNAFNSFNSIGYRKGKTSVNSFYNFKKGDGYRNNSEYDAHNLFLNFNHKFNDKTEIGAEFTYFKYLAKQAGGLTDEQFNLTPRLSTRDRNWFEVDWKLYNTFLKHELTKSSTLSLSLFHLDASRKSVGFRGNPINLNENPITAIDEQDSNGNYLNPRDLIVGNFKNIGGEVRYLNRYSISKSKNGAFLIGAKYFKSNNTSLQGPGSKNGDADFEFYTDDFADYANQSSFKFPNFNFSLFSENIFYLSNELSITPGIRFEHIKTVADGTYNQVVFDNAGNPISNNLKTDDKSLTRNFALMGVGLHYKYSEGFQLVANLSQNYRSVTFSDIRVVSPTFIVDPDIQDEKGFTADFGLKGRKKDILSYDISAFSVLYDDRIGIILDDRANRVRKNIGKAIIAGTESLVIVNFARWVDKGPRNYKLNAFTNTSFTFSKYLQSDQNNVEGNQVEFIPMVNLKTGVTTGFKNMELTYQFTYLSKQFTDVQNSETPGVGDNRSGIIGPIPAYAISDLTFSYKFKDFKIEAGINNLMNRSYFTRRATGYPGPGIIPSDGRAFFVTVGYGR